MACQAHTLFCFSDRGSPLCLLTIRMHLTALVYGNFVLYGIYGCLSCTKTRGTRQESSVSLGMTLVYKESAQANAMLCAEIIKTRYSRLLITCLVDTWSSLITPRRSFPGNRIAERCDGRPSGAKHKALAETGPTTSRPCRVKPRIWHVFGWLRSERYFTLLMTIRAAKSCFRQVSQRGKICRGPPLAGYFVLWCRWLQKVRRRMN